MSRQRQRFSHMKMESLVGDEEHPLKIYFIPYLAAGHMIPLSDIARLFASRGHHATVITTPSNAQILLKSNPHPHHFRVHAIQFPSQQVGLPDGVENLAAVTTHDDSIKIYYATMLLQQPIEDFVEQNLPDCIVADFLYPWVHELANKLGIPRFAFNGFPLFTICAMESVRSEPDLDPSGPFLIPNLPHPIAMRAAPPKDSREFIENLLETEVKSNGLLVNNFVDFDGEEYVQFYHKITGHKAWHLGPASLVRRTPQEKTERGNNSVVSAEECLSWLNSKRVNSVVYICFGTVCYFPDEQLYEIACGLEASGCDFIWVVPEKKGKENECNEEKEKWMPKGFDEKKKGMIIRGWAPQLLILDHPAIGAILTHCGWNSTVEAICAGVPMITWPVHSDQFYNEKLICEVRGIGVEVGADEWSTVRFLDRVKNLIGRERIKKAVRRLMDGSDEAQEIRRRARELGNKARAAVEEGGSSHQNLTVLIDQLKRLRNSRPLD